MSDPREVFFNSAAVRTVFLIAFIAGSGFTSIVAGLERYELSYSATVVLFFKWGAPISLEHTVQAPMQTLILIGPLVALRDGSLLSVLTPGVGPVAYVLTCPWFAIKGIDGLRTGLASWRTLAGTLGMSILIWYLSGDLGKVVEQSKFLEALAYCSVLIFLQSIIGTGIGEYVRQHGTNGRVTQFALLTSGWCLLALACSHGLARVIPIGVSAGLTLAIGVLVLGVLRLTTASTQRANS